VTLAEAERYLLSLELFGMRFGLDRMRRLMTVMGSPQERFGSIHVVGTNGKSSTTRMIAAILHRHGLRAGAYLSPHLTSFAERVRVDDRDVTPEAFGAAVERARAAAAKVDRTNDADDHVTQFEALTAAAYSELARAGVDVAVIEAGLGGRWDATNVIDAPIAVLTNIDLEHTRWLGSTVREIAREKLAVLAPVATLVLGAGLHPDAHEEAAAHAAKQGAMILEAPAEPDAFAPEIELLALGDFQRRNFALARAAADAYLDGALDEHAVAAAAASTLVPGRFEVVGESPAVVVDGAHNPGGMEALADALESYADGRRVVACVSVLDDKDATAMLRTLLPLCSEVVCTASANPRALSPATLQSLCAQLGGPPARTVSEPHRALAVARELAGPDGVAVATGSIYLVADLLRPAGARMRSTL
jgi:dihydrofolate synthase/folylpolyglutamate synthase